MAHSSNNCEINEVAVARTNGTIELFSLESGTPTAEYPVFTPSVNEKGSKVLNKHGKPQHFVGLHCYQNWIISCTDTGTISYINRGQFNLGNDLGMIACKVSLGIDMICKMRVHPSKPYLFATGGDDRNLSIWDIRLGHSSVRENESLQFLKPVWQSKNVPHDWLDMQVPIWITDLQWLASPADASFDEPTAKLVGEYNLVSSTGYHQIRLHNTLKKVPTASYNHGEHPIKTLQVSGSDEDFVVGDTTGLAWSLKKSGEALGSFRGISGAVGDIHVCSAADYIVTVGIDRQLRVFEASGKRRLVQIVLYYFIQSYLKQRLTSLIVDEVWGSLQEIDVSQETEVLWDHIPVVDEANLAGVVKVADSEENTCSDEDTANESLNAECEISGSDCSSDFGDESSQEEDTPNSKRVRR